MSAQAKLARLDRSLVLLRDHFGERYGEGPKVELWHALDDLIRTTASIREDVETLAPTVREVSR